MAVNKFKQTAEPHFWSYGLNSIIKKCNSAPTISTGEKKSNEQFDFPFLMDIGTDLRRSMCPTGM